MTFYGRKYIMVEEKIYIKRSIFRKKGGSPSQVRYCKSQILNVLFGRERTCGNREISKDAVRRVFVVRQKLFFQLTDIIAKGGR